MMKKSSIGAIAIIIAFITFTFSQCSQPETKTAAENNADTTAVSKNYQGFESAAKWGEHLVLIGGCNDCHTPKKMGPMGPEPDMSLMLSGHPSKMPPPDVDRKALESKGNFASNTLTAWVGPWGISYAANLTSDSTGVGNWTEEQFILCLRQGKWKGLADSRPLLPPMPWQGLAQLSDDELKAIYAYLKSTKPINNVVPAPAPPVLAAAHH